MFPLRQEAGWRGSSVPLEPSSASEGMSLTLLRGSEMSNASAEQHIVFIPSFIQRELGCVFTDHKNAGNTWVESVCGQPIKIFHLRQLGVAFVSAAAEAWGAWGGCTHLGRNDRPSAVSPAPITWQALRTPVVSRCRAEMEQLEQFSRVSH